MKIIKNVFFKVRDFYEIVVPTVAYALMFFVFIWGIFTRYILKDSATWSNEVQILGYLWTVLPAACWARRRNDHVSFSLLYDSVNPVKQRIIHILGNLFMVVLYAFLLKASIKYVINLRQKSMALELSLKVLYLPFPFMVGGFWIYSLYDLIKDIVDIVLEKLGRKEHISMQKVDKAAEFLAASEAEYREQFSSWAEEDEKLMAELEKEKEDEK